MRVPIYKRSLFVFLSLAIVMIAGSMYGFQEKDKVVELDAGTKAEARPEEITVYVSGAVNKPGVIKVEDGARIIDAVNLCGGVLPTADTAKINMAQVIKDGAQINVPEKLTVAAKTGDAENAVTKTRQSDTEKININTADKKELDRLPGVGPALAEAILEYRNTEGLFQQIEDLKKVRGIGEAKYQKMQDKVTL